MPRSRRTQKHAHNETDPENEHPSGQNVPQRSDGELREAEQPRSPIGLALWNFSSEWFLIPQGLGIVAVTLHQLDYQFDGLSIISVVVWLYTIALLAVGVFLYLLRIFLYPRHVVSVLRASIIETSCLASISITFTTIIIMVTVVLVRQWGSAWGIVVYVLWWINTAMAVASVMWIPYVHVKVQPPGLEAVAPGMLLPLISTLTSAAGGGFICRYGALSDDSQVPVIIVSYLEVGIGLPFAVTLSGVFVTKLINKSFPGIEHVCEDMILCGPFGQGSFALQALGQVVSRGSFAGYDRGTFLTTEAAQPVAFASQFAGLLSWGYGTFWWVFAITSILHTFFSQIRGHRNTRFTLSPWAIVFPWVCVETLLYVTLSDLFSSKRVSIRTLRWN